MNVAARRAAFVLAPILISLGIALVSATYAQRARAQEPPAIDAGAATVNAVPTTPTPTPTPTPTTTADVAGRPQPRSLTELKAGAVDQDWGGRARCFAGMLAIIGIAWVLSENKRRVDWRLVVTGTVIQLVFAVIVLKTFVGRSVFGAANEAINRLLGFSDMGARFIFGNLVNNNIPVGTPLFEPKDLSPIKAAGDLVAATGTMFAFRVLPTILLFSALTALLYHLGVLQWIVRGIAFVMQKSLGTSGAESLSVAPNIFPGQTESPLLVKPYLAKMTRSELMAVMVAGFATVAGGVMAAYVGMLSSTFPDIAGHLLAASVMGAPASFVMAKIMIPETEVPETSDASKIPMEKVDANALDATTRGTTEGLALALNVGAMLIVFIALIALINALFGWAGGMVGIDGLTLQRIFGWVGAPLAWLLGVPWDDATAVGSLLGTKTAVNEFVAYDQLAGMLQQGTITHGKSVVIATYALCGFANFSSIGIQIGGIATMAPNRRGDIARLGLYAMVCGSLATFQTAAIAGMFL